MARYARKIGSCIAPSEVQMNYKLNKENTMKISEVEQN